MIFKLILVIKKIFFKNFINLISSIIQIAIITIL